MPDSPVISGVADLPKFYFAEGAPFRLSLTIGAEFSMTGKFVTFGMRARSGTVRRVFGTDSGEANLTIAGQVITLNIATNAATVPAFASGWTLEDVQAKGETEYWVDISATEGSDVLLRLQGQADWVAPGSDIAESSAVVSSPAIDVNIASGAVSVSVAVLGAAEPTLTTNTATSGLTGILKAASNTLDVAVAGTDYVATNDSRLTDARTPTSHVHGGISNAGAIGSTSGLPIKTGASGVLEAGAFGTGSGQFAQGNDARFHDRSHAMTSTSDHTAGNWKVFHSNGSGQLVELALGANDTFLKSNGASAAPSFATPAGGGSSITGTGFAYVRSGGNNSTAVIGNPSLPYLTAQAAWNAGARLFELGVGSHTITHVSDPSDTINIFVRGAGRELTTLNFSFTGTEGEAGGIQSDFGQTGNPGTSGGNAGTFTLSSDRSLSIHLVARGGNGGNGGQGGPGSADPEIVSGNGGYGGNAGNGPTYEVYNCVLASLSKDAQPGQGGPAGVDGGFGIGIPGASGTSGVAVVEHYYWSDIDPTGNNMSSSDMDACLRGGTLFATVPSNRVQYGGGFVENALDVLYGERVETRRIESTNWVTTSSTVADVNNLSCLIAPSEQLTIEIFGFHTSGTGGMKVSFSGPSTPTFLRYNFHHWTSVTAVRSPIPGAATAFNTDLTEGAGSTVVMPFHVLLTVKNGANQGTIQFRAASVTGGQTLTLLQETVMRVTR